MTDTTNMKPYIICCGSDLGRAVVFCWCDVEPTPGQPVVMYNAQMIIRWDAACGALFGLATNGPRGDTRITKPLARVADKFCTQVLSVSEDAVRAFAEWRCV